MTGQKKKKRLPIPAAALTVLFLAVLLSAVFLSGCASSKYQAIEIEGIGTEAASQEEKESAGGELDVELETEAGEAPKAGEPASADAEAQGPQEAARNADLALQEPQEASVNADLALQGPQEAARNADLAPQEPQETSVNADPAAQPVAAPGEDETFFNGHIVAIDAGHQAKANAEKEPIGPSSETMKAKMPAGAVGTVLGVKEYELTLTVAEKLKEELENKGYQVVMIRESHDVNLSNSERARIANESGAEIFIRLHANSMENTGVYGALAMCMTAQNPYNAPLHDNSYRLAKTIIDQVCALTGTKNRGVQEVDNNGEINWSEIPVAVVEMGFLSNPDEERWLSEGDYQDKIVSGIAAAVDSYFTN